MAAGESDSGTAVQLATLFGPEIQVPSTAAQQEIFFASLFDTAASLGYNHSISLFLKGQLDLDALYSALLNLLNRHEALRGRFSPDGKTFLVRARIAFELPLRDLRGVAATERDAAYNAIAKAEGDHPFDLLEGPLFRAVLVRRADDDWTLIFTCHHVVVDGWSLKIILRDLPKLYSALAQGRSTALLPRADSFVEYVSTVLETERNHHEATRTYWRGIYADGPPLLELPLDRPRPRTRTYDSLREDFQVDHDVYTRLRAEGAKHGISQFITLLSAFSLFIYRLTGQADHVVGVPVAGQIKSGKSGLLGHDARVLPIRCLVQDTDTFETYSKRMQQTFLDAFEHQWITIPELLRSLGLKFDASRASFVSVMFNFDPGMDESVYDYKDLKASHYFNPRSAETFEISVNAVVERNELILEWAYNQELFDADEMKLRLQQFQQMMRSIVDEPATSVARIGVVPADQLQQMDAALNATEMPFEKALCVDQLIERVVRTQPDKVAVEHGSTQLTYAQLWARSDCVLAGLAKLGLGQNALVGVMLERSADMVAALLGIWRAGAAFVPLDPAYPEDRLNYMVEHSGMRVVLTQRSIASIEAMEQVRRIDLEDILQTPHGPVVAAVRRNSEDRAYVIYTSGSTGRPKGVQVPHRALNNFLVTMLSQSPGITPDDRLLAVTTLSFDIAELELWLPLVAGATTIIADRDTVVDGQALVQLLRDARITFLQATPSTWRLLLFAGWSGNTKMTALCGGEALPRELANELLPLVGVLWNVYGPTETTVWSTIDRVGQGAITIGKPIGNTQTYVLDAHQGWLPRGCVGELWIGGDGVTLGYLGRDDLTRERFIPNPFTGRGLMYKTGDCVKLRRDGRIEYVGRNDFQVKVRGHRIELGEIETQLASHADVRQAIVLAREDRPGDVRLVAYFVTANAQLGAAELRTHLNGKLPAYMMPQHYVRLETVPLLPNGKVNRQGLPAPAGAHAEPERTLEDQPQNAQEQLVAGLFSRLLDLPTVGVNDDFFELGGHSILAVQLIQSLEKDWQCKLTPSVLLERRTVRELVAWHTGSGDTERATLVPIRPGGDGAPVFLIHDADGETLLYLNLARRLHPRHAVYALQPKLLKDGRAAHLTIPEMAAHYVQQIQALGQTGPVVLGGLCAGGVIAFEVALQLQHAGRPTGLVALIDAVETSMSVRSSTVALNRVKSFLGAFERVPGESWLPYASRALKTAAGKAVRFVYYRISAWRRGRDAARNVERLRNTAPELDLTATQAIALPTVRDIYLHAINDYSPAEPLDSAVLLYRATLGDNSFGAGNMTAVEAIGDPLLGWQKHVSQPITAVDIPGDHSTMLQEPNVATISETMQQQMDRFDPQDSRRGALAEGLRAVVQASGQAA